VKIGAILLIAWPSWSPASSACWWCKWCLWHRFLSFHMDSNFLEIASWNVLPPEPMKVEKKPVDPAIICPHFLQAQIGHQEATVTDRTRNEKQIFFPINPHVHCTTHSSSSSVFALAWRNCSPRSITPLRFYERFCVPLRLGANWGYWPSDSVFDQGGGVHHKLLICLPLA
jgi:hypothetical protein